MTNYLISYTRPKSDDHNDHGNYYCGPCAWSLSPNEFEFVNVTVDFEPFCSCCDGNAARVLKTVQSVMSEAK